MVDQLLARLTLEEKIGQLVMAALPGPELGAEQVALLRDHSIGNIALFSRNIVSIEQTRALTAAIHDLCAVDGLPPLISADQEGGRVQRLMPEATSFPSAMALGATGDPVLIERIGQAIGLELRALGINNDFAPCVDVNNNPQNPVIGTRSFGESPERVSELGVAFARGLHAAGVVATAKHFPGHGDTQVDSHLDLPTIPHDLTRLRAVELAPFAATIAAGIPMVMTTHIRFPALEPDGLPATLSRRILIGLLRDEMGFEGVIVSDAMVMQAIVDYYGLVAGSVAAIIAGCDIVVPHGDEAPVVAGLLDAVRDGRLPMAQVDASVRRILRLKQWVAAQPDVSLDVVGGHRALVREAAEASVTLLDARPNALPIQPETEIAVVEFGIDRRHGAEEGTIARAPLLDAFRGWFPHARGVTLSALNPTADDLAAARALASESAILVIGTRDANQFPAQRATIDALRTANRPTIFVSMRAPYDLADFPWAAARIATYGDLPVSLDVAAAICAGAFTPRGYLPVSVGPR